MSRTTYAGIAVIAATIVAVFTIPSFAAGSPRGLLAMLPLIQASGTNACRVEDRSWIEFAVPFDDQSTSYEPGQVLSLSDGTLALLIVVTNTNDEARLTGFDFAASVRISAIVLRSGDSVDVRRFDPPVRNGAGIRAPERGTIDGVSFCYTVNLPAPPQPSDPEATAAATSPGAATESAQATATSTALTLDVSGQQTAEALATEVAITATAAANDSATQVAAAETQAAELAETTTAQNQALETAQAEAAAARETVAALEATVQAPTVVPTETPTPSGEAEETATAQAEALERAQAEVVAARATIAALEATVQAPTPTSTPEPTPTAIPEQVVYETSGEEAFVEWQAPEGWDVEGEVASTDGEGPRDWVVLPSPAGIGPDYAVQIEFRVTGGEICPRNFGLGLRGSEGGFYAAGIEWACDPTVVLWAGATELAREQLPDGIDPSQDWHTLRIEAVGDVITVSLDGIQVISEQDEAFASGALVALWSDKVALEIRAAEIVELGS